MSKAKGLEFDRTQPAFLRRLKGEIAGQVDDPDRHVNAVSRPTRPKRLENDDDDEPTYVLEETNATVTKDEYELMMKGEPEGDKDKPKASETSTKVSGDDIEAVSSKPQQVAHIGATKKRKVAKMVGKDDSDDDKDKSNKSPEIDTVPSKGKKASGKKKAKVQLSYGDDEDP